MAMQRRLPRGRTAKIGRFVKTYRDIAGDGGSRILEQVAEQKARIDRNLAGVRRRIAIGSGKGGVTSRTERSTQTSLLYWIQQLVAHYK